MSDTTTAALPAEITDAVNSYANAIVRRVLATESGTREQRANAGDAEDAARAALDEVIGRYVEEHQRYEAAIRWALGYEDFPERQPGQGAYWWRTELHARSGYVAPEDLVTDAAARSTPRPPSR